MSTTNKILVLIIVVIATIFLCDFSLELISNPSTFNISKDDITVDALKSWKEEINTDAMIGEMRAKFRFV